MHQVVPSLWNESKWNKSDGFELVKPFPDDWRVLVLLLQAFFADIFPYGLSEVNVATIDSCIREMQSEGIHSSWFEVTENNLKCIKNNKINLAQCNLIKFYFRI